MSHDESDKPQISAEANPKMVLSYFIHLIALIFLLYGSWLEILNPGAVWSVAPPGIFLFVIVLTSLFFGKKVPLVKPSQESISITKEILVLFSIIGTFFILSILSYNLIWEMYGRVYMNMLPLYFSSVLILFVIVVFSMLFPSSNATD